MDIKQYEPHDFSETNVEGYGAFTIFPIGMTIAHLSQGRHISPPARQPVNNSSRGLMAD